LWNPAIWRRAARYTRQCQPTSKDPGYAPRCADERSETLEETMGQMIENTSLHDCDMHRRLLRFVGANPEQAPLFERESREP
jgi:hypothetical protein